MRSGRTIYMRHTRIGAQNHFTPALGTRVLAALLHLDQASHAEPMSTVEFDGFESDITADGANIVVERWDDGQQSVGKCRQENMWQ